MEIDKIGRREVRRVCIFDFIGMVELSIYDFWLRFFFLEFIMSIIV